MVSVLILTKDEEHNLPHCLETLRWSDDIHVLDSFSTDRTVEIARESGATVWQHPFESFSSQQNWALMNIQFQHPWVFYLDADERVTPRLAEAVQAAAGKPGAAVAFEVERRDFFLGTWLKHTQVTPYYLRLFRHDKMRYERAGHPVSVPDGPVSRVEGYLDHNPFSKGIAQWVEKHNFYSTQEAGEILAGHRLAGKLNPWKAFFSRDFSERRRHQKQLYYRLPCRPLVKFAGMYLLKRGFLDGRAGLAYSILIGFYEYMIVLKVHELERHPPGQAVAKAARPTAVA